MKAVASDIMPTKIVPNKYVGDVMLPLLKNFIEGKVVGPRGRVKGRNKKSDYIKVLAKIYVMAFTPLIRVMMEAHKYEIEDNEVELKRFSDANSTKTSVNANGFIITPQCSLWDTII